MKMYMSEK